MAYAVNRQWHMTAFLFCFLLFFSFSLPRTVKSDNISEYKIKGAMIVNFIRFASWPDPDIESGKTSIVVGIMGNSAPFDAFAPMDGRNVAGRKLSVRHIDAVYQIPECQVLFIDKSQRFRLTEIMDAVDDMPILTIGESGDFLKTGGLIRFYLQNGHIRFAINGKTAAESPVRISSKLMEIGKIVY